MADTVMICPDPSRAANIGAGELEVTAVSGIDEEHRSKLSQSKCLRADRSSLACHGHRRDNDLLQVAPAFCLKAMLRALQADWSIAMVICQKGWHVLVHVCTSLESG